MCGPSSQEKQITQEQADFYKQLQSQYSSVFGANQNILGALTSSFTPLLKAGPSQEGMAPAERTALETQNTEHVATDYAQAQRATAQALAGRGGGNTFLPSSATNNLLAANANAAAASRAQGQQNITMQNYALGRQNWQTAADVLSNTAAQYNPNAFAGNTMTAGNNAMTSANAMAQQSFAPWGAAFSALGGIAGQAVGAYGAKHF